LTPSALPPSALPPSGLPPRVAGFPFPLARDAYRYSANLEPAPGRRDTAAGAWGETIMNAGPDYEEFIAARARVLDRHPGLLITAPHMRAAEWDTLRYVMRRLAAEYPRDFRLSEDGRRWQWANRRLGAGQGLTVGDDASLPCGPLEYIGRQVVEDLVLMDAREGHLYADAGLVSFASGWSFPFVAGMSFTEIHGPVPRANPDGVFTRAEAFLLRLPPGQACRRVNWAFQASRVLDKSIDNHAEWMPAAARVLATATEAGFGRQVHLRVEVQHLIGLETADAVLFLIDTRFLSLAELAAVPEWARRVITVLEELPPDMADYKGITALRPRITGWLRRHAPARP
jgi:dimethylamine monooxygenase subunit A